MGEVSAITFESLYDTVRKEKTTEDLQKLNPNFFTQITDYLKTKTDVYKSSKEKNSMNPIELEKIKTQIVNARKLVKDLYERREKKILQLSLHKSRTKEADESSLLPEEKMFYEQITLYLDKYRADILLNLVNARLPIITSEIPKLIEKITVVQEAPKKEIERKEPFTEKILIKFTTEVPAFLGPNMETYGPFVPGDEINLYAEMADTLLKMKAAEKI